MKKKTIYKDRKIKINGKTYIKVGFDGYIDKVSFSEIIFCFKNFDCYYLSEEKCGFFQGGTGRNV